MPEAAGPGGASKLLLEWNLEATTSPVLFIYGTISDVHDFDVRWIPEIYIKGIGNVRPIKKKGASIHHDCAWTPMEVPGIVCEADLERIASELERRFSPSIRTLIVPQAAGASDAGKASNLMALRSVTSVSAAIAAILVGK